MSRRIGSALRHTRPSLNGQFHDGQDGALFVAHFGEAPHGCEGNREMR